MKKATLTLILFFIGFLSTAQNNNDAIIHDPQAKTILDKLSATLNGKSTRIYFLYTQNNAQDTSKNQFYGYLFVKGEKYKAIIPNAEYFSDGVKTYTYNKKANEMNIALSDPNNEQSFTPDKMLNAYKKGYKYSYRGDITANFKVKVDDKIVTQKITCAIIDLFPEKIKSSPISIIRLWIDKTNNVLVSIRFQYKNGIEEDLELLEFKIDVTLADDLFKFDKTKYPANLDVIDFTEN